MNKEELLTKLKDEKIEPKEAIKLRGKLISILKKELRGIKDQKLALPIKLQLHEELKKHKEMLKKRELEGSVPIPERVGLKVKEIANAIEIFKEKHDVLNRVKNTAISTAIGTLFAGAVAAGIGLIGGTFSLAGIIPAVAFSGISGLLRLPFNETTWSKLAKSVDSKDKNQQAIIEFLNTKVKENKKLMDLLKRKTEKPGEEELLKINEQLIVEYSALIKESPIDDLTKILTFEKINLITEQKKTYEQIKKEYIKNKRKLTPGQLVDLEKNLISTNLQLTKENAFIKDVLKQSGKDFAISSGILVAASAIISVAFPQYSTFSLANLSVPMIFTLLGNIANMGSLKEKIRLEKEQYDKAKTTLSKEQVQKLLQQNRTSLQMA
jgi:hypothetical protein